MIQWDAASKRRQGLLLGVLAVSAWWLCGCAMPTGQGPWRVAKPNMQFGEERALNVPIRISAQLEPGRVVSGGAQASVCTSCR